MRINKSEPAAKTNSMDFIPTIEDEEDIPPSQRWDEESDTDTEEEAGMVYLQNT